MRSQVLTLQSSAVQAFTSLLRAHAVATRHLNGRLVAEHGLTINDYEVLLRLSGAPARRMRRVDLAAKVVLTPSGITRLLDGLERNGLVTRQACDSDRRVVYAVLTDEGQAKVDAASKSHFGQIDELLRAQLDESELQTLTELLARFDGDRAGAEAPAAS